jgi:segregation and condensation protein A
MALTLVLEEFSGPLDLLWHLIKEEKVDIYDIPIARITEQYLAYLHAMQERALDVAGDYFVMAASLMAMKSRMLLPEPEMDEPEDDAEDPRADLVAQLLNYQVYQEAASEMKTLETKRAALYAKPASLPPDDVIAPLAPGAVKLRDLTNAMNAVLRRIASTQQVVRRIETDSVSLEDKIDAIKTKLAMSGQCDFIDLVSAPTVSEVVTTFLAILELMKKDSIVCEQDDLHAPIMVYLNPSVQTA